MDFYVSRARAFRLYTHGPEGDRRLVDLRQDGGASILGHKPHLVLRDLKNTADRGLFSPFPHPLEGRLYRALSRVFPGRVFRVYEPGSSLSRVLADAGITWDGPLPDPALETVKDVPLALWRPFLEEGSLSTGIPIFVPVLPGVPFLTQNATSRWPPGLNILAVEASFAARMKGELPPSGRVSPFILAAAVRGLHDLLAAPPQRAMPAFPKVYEALSKSNWERRGVYLSWKGGSSDQERRKALAGPFFDGGFYLPALDPVILPGELSPGEEARLSALLRL